MKQSQTATGTMLRGITGLASQIDPSVFSSFTGGGSAPLVTDNNLVPTSYGTGGGAQTNPNSGFSNNYYGGTPKFNINE